MTGQKTRRLLCTSRVYVPVGKIVPQADELPSLVRIIVREFPFRQVLLFVHIIKECAPHLRSRALSLNREQRSPN